MLDTFEWCGLIVLQYPIITARCENYDNRCEGLAKKGECNNSTKKYLIATQCRKACNSCGGELDNS